jgi:hypothetical protein
MNLPISFGPDVKFWPVVEKVERRCVTRGSSVGDRKSTRSGEVLPGNTITSRLRLVGDRPAGPIL